MKYIAFEGRFHAEVVTFADHHMHDQMALLLNIKSEDILGAGFVTNGFAGECVCFGESNSLGVKSRDNLDSDILNKLMKR